MLPRVAAFCVAVSIVVWPAGAGSDTDTFWSSPSAAVLASIVAPAPATAFTPATAPAPLAALGETQLPAIAATDAKPDEGTPGKPETDADSQAQIDGPQHTAAPDSTKSRPPAPLVSEPFGLAVTPVWFGKILSNWSGVEAAIRTDNETLTRCGDDAQRCPQAARKFLAIVAQGRAQAGLARVGIINRAINMAIEPMSDMAQWGVPDRWSPPLETFTTGKGDCEDYAIAKYVALTAAGVDAADVKLIIVHNTEANEDHAVTAVRIDGDWIVLDNRWLTLVVDVDMPKVVPLFVLDDQGVKRFAPPALVGSRQVAAPASF